MPLGKIIAAIGNKPNLEGEISSVQYGTIPYQIIDDHVVFLLITSRRSANWVFPKGSEIKGLSATQTAMQETFEEAGVCGDISDEPIGSYRHVGNSPKEPLVEVQLYPMLVTEQLDEWPEKEQRFRHWVLLSQAKKLLASKDAAKLAVDLNRRFMFPDQDGSTSLSAT